MPSEVHFITDVLYKHVNRKNFLSLVSVICILNLFKKEIYP